MNGEPDSLILRDNTGRFYVLPHAALEAAQASVDLQAALEAYFAEREVVGHGGPLGFLGGGVRGISPYDRPISNMGFGDGDIEAVSFIALMNATADMDKDLKSILHPTARHRR